MADALGSTIALTDANGTTQTQYSYDPFGSTSTSGAASTNSYQFTGREFDVAGLYYYRARYYSPVTGRFISEDPLGLAAGINEYSYADGDPNLFRDPRGTSLCPVHVFETWFATVLAGYDGDEGLVAGIGVCLQDWGTQGTSWQDTRRHAMGGRKDNGNTQDPCQAYDSTRDFINNTDNPAAAIHAIQDSYASGHQYKLWEGGIQTFGTPTGLPYPSHVFGDSYPLPSAEFATKRYLEDYANHDLQDASQYLSPQPACSI